MPSGDLRDPVTGLGRTQAKARGWREVGPDALWIGLLLRLQVWPESLFTVSDIHVSQ